jgi:hypothetical protein
MENEDIIRMALELATRHGIRMCDENGDTHGEELYCVGLDDIAEIIKQVAAAEREACAKVADAWDHDKRIAAAIRARGDHAQD